MRPADPPYNPRLPMRLAALHADLSPPLPSTREPSAVPEPERSGQLKPAQSDDNDPPAPARHRTEDPFLRLLTLTTPITTARSQARATPVPGAAVRAHGGNPLSAGRPAASAVTVGGLCRYMRRCGLHETSSAFLAAVAAAAEARREAQQKREQRKQYARQATLQHAKASVAETETSEGARASFAGRVMPGQMVLLKNRSLGRRAEPQLSREGSIVEDTARMQRVRSSIVLPFARASSVLVSEAADGAPSLDDGDDLGSDQAVEDAVRDAGGPAGRSFLAAKTVLSEHSSKLQSFAAIAFMPPPGKKATPAWAGAHRTLKAVQCAREVLSGLAPRGGQAGEPAGQSGVVGDGAGPTTRLTVAAVTEHGALAGRLAFGDVIGERVLHHGMRGGPVEPAAGKGRLPPMQRSATVIAAEPCVVMEVTARHFQQVSEESSVVCAPWYTLASLHGLHWPGSLIDVPVGCTEHQSYLLHISQHRTRGRSVPGCFVIPLDAPDNWQTHTCFGSACVADMT